MSVLDLQGLETVRDSKGGGDKGSKGSKGCNNDHSSFSLLLC
jgi:SapB morphogen precursor RamS